MTAPPRLLAALGIIALTLLAPAAPLSAQNAPDSAPPTQEELNEQARQLQEQALEMQREMLEGFAEGGAAAAGSLIVSVIGGLIFGAVIYAVFALLIYIPYSKVPAEHQKMSPAAVFLIVIPLFNLVWNFIMTARVSESFKSYFDSVGDTSVGDAGKTLGLWFSICAAASFALTLTFILACLGFPVGVAALVLVIIYIVKLFGMAGKINDGAAAPPPAA